jgi:hypothetical protein
MSFYRRNTELPPMPFTGMLRAIDIEASRNESSVLCASKLGHERPEGAVFQAKALRAVERLLAGVERFWDAAPPSPMSIKEMIARFEALKAQAPVFVEPQRQQEIREIKAASSLEGDDD